MSPITLPPAYLDLPAVSTYLALSESTVQKLTREEVTFPKPRLLSGRRVGYLVRELHEWAESRPVANLAPPVNAGYGRAGKAA